MRPLTAVALAAIVTSYFVAAGNFFAGVKIRIVVPDQRYVPATAGVIVMKDGLTLGGTAPMASIGSEKTTRTSFAS